MSEQARNRQSPEDIQRDIQRTREEMDRTLAVLNRRLSPGGMVDTALQSARNGAGADFLRSLGDSIRRNPWPVTITAVGLGWLILSTTRPRAQYRTAPVPRTSVPVPVTEPVMTEGAATTGEAEHGTASIEYGERQADTHAEGLASIEHGRQQAQGQP